MKWAYDAHERIQFSDIPAAHPQWPIEFFVNEADLDGRVIIWALYQGVTSVDISVGKLKLVLTKSYLVKVEKERLLDWAGVVVVAVVVVCVWWHCLDSEVQATECARAGVFKASHIFKRVLS